MDGLFERMAPLWRPHRSLTDGASQRRARVAAGILLVLLPLLALAFLFPHEPDGPLLSGHRLTALAFLGLATSYALVRSGMVVVGVLVAVATIEAALALSVANADEHETGLQVLAFFVVPIAMAGILLPVPWAAAVGALTIALALGLETALEGRPLTAGPDQHGFTLGLQLLAVYALAVVSALMVERQARDLEQSRELLRQVTENIPEVLFVVSADGRRMLYTSPAYETVVGRPVAQAMADPQDWLKAVHPEDLARVKEGLGRGEPVLEYRIVMPWGAVKDIRARTFPVHGPDGRPSTIVGIAEDVTEARLAQAKLREAQRERIHLLQQLAHDLGTPLTPVKLQLHLLQDQAGPAARQSLAIVRRNVDHLERLVADVRDVARLEGGGLRLERQEVDLVDLVKKALETLGPTAAARQVTLAIESPLALSANSDPARVTQVLYNLVGNALKFTPAGGTVTIAIAREDGHIRVDVRDTGSGMRPDQLVRLFKPFSQVHDPGMVKRPEDKGSGLGLFISNGIVEAHGGTMRVRSAGPGLGSTFTFLLPVAPS